MNALRDAIETVGGQTRLALMVGVSPQRLSNWLDRGVPPERCPDIEAATSGAVTCEQMRPGIAWVRVPDEKWPHVGGRPCIDVARQVA